MEKFFPDEYGNVKAENDWVTAQVARYPDRLVGFCGVSPLKDYAVQEVRRCASELPMKGLKIHFGSSGVDVLNPEHLDKVRRAFRTANELGLAIVVHTNGYCCSIQFAKLASLETLVFASGFRFIQRLYKSLYLNRRLYEINKKYLYKLFYPCFSSSFCSDG